MRPIRLVALCGLAVIARGTARAQVTYRVQPIIKLGDRVGDVLIPPNSLLGVQALNDKSQTLIVVADRSWQPRMLFQYTDGKVTPIVVPGRDAPGGKWPNGGIIRQPMNMNERGNVAFTAEITIGSKTSWGTFRWDAKTQQVATVALPGMPAGHNLTFLQGGASGATINNDDEIAFAAQVPSSHGGAPGIFFLGRDGKLLTVAFPDQELPGGARLHAAGLPSLNDAGVVAFLAWRFASDFASGYLWENGSLTLIAVVGTDAPGGGKISEVTGVRVNNKNRKVLVGANLRSSRGRHLYQFANGELTPVLVPGQAMPGGGILKGETWGSYASDAGQHAVTASLEDGTTGVYLLDVDGKLSLLLKSGTPTDLGTITRIGARYTEGLIQSSYGVGFNSEGQIAVPVQIEGGVDTVVLLTPTVP